MSFTTILFYYIGQTPPKTCSGEISGTENPSEQKHKFNLKNSNDADIYDLIKVGQGYSNKNPKHHYGYININSLRNKIKFKGCSC